MKILAALATVLALVLPTQALATNNFNFGANSPCSFCSEFMDMFTGNDPANMFPTPPADPGYTPPSGGYTPPSGFGFFTQNFTHPANPFDFTSYCSNCGAGMPFDFTSYCSDCGMFFDPFGTIFNCSYCEAYCPTCGGGTPAVPEAENYALLLVGLAFVGYAAQRRRKLS